jgi:hypothetical protein
MPGNGVLGLRPCPRIADNRVQMLASLRAAVSILLVVAACGDDDSGDDVASGSTSGEATQGGESTGPGDDTSATSMAETGSAAGDDTGEPTETTTGDESDDVSTALVSIVAQANTLVRIDVGTGTATEICTLPEAASYDSITFTAEGTLFAHNVARNRIETINPCNCGFQIAGLTGAGPLELTSDGDEGLVGLDLGLDAFSVINPKTGLATVVGPVGLPLTTAGLAWDFTAGVPIMLDVTTSALYSLDPSSGSATHVANLSQPLSGAGMDMLEPTGELFVCAADALHRVDIDTGVVTTIGALGIGTACNNLAAPPVAIACLE